MSIIVTVNDESTAGEITHSIDLSFLNEEITVRELIRSRVFQEVKDFIAADSGAVWRGLVKPTEAEAVANGFQLRKKKNIDWELQFEKACDAFESNQLLVLVDNRQAVSLEEPVSLTPATKISFLKLVLLVGG